MFKILPVNFEYSILFLLCSVGILKSEQVNFKKDQISRTYNTEQFYNFKNEYSLNILKIYEQYLKEDSQISCGEYSGSVNDLTNDEINEATEIANKQIDEFIVNDQKYLANYKRLANFSSSIYQNALNALHNEFISNNLVKLKCLNEFEITSRLSAIELSAEDSLCETNSAESLLAKCNPDYMYRREDGKCNNPVNTNWGSSFRCHRRLLPPNYADGLSKPRVAVNGSPLPNPRLVSKQLLPVRNEPDQKRNNLHMIWGQFFVHDVFKTLQFWGNALDCCNESMTHDECLPISPLPKDKLSVAFNQTCQSFVRSLSCKTCSLGYREQLNAATPLIDLSNVYGGNLNITIRIRSFKNGTLRGDLDTNGSYILPGLDNKKDFDSIDLLRCNPPPDRPWIKCQLTGDGMRGNQQAMLMALHTVWNRRHNQHARALSKVNSHWDDERIYQEARRISIAEFAKINFFEYFPSILNKKLIDYYQLSLRKDGYTEYNPEVDPTGIQAVSVGALRFGHSQIHSGYQVIKKLKTDSYGFQLKNKFLDVSDIWDGNTNGIIAGLSAVPSQSVDPFVSSDVQDYVLFRGSDPKMRDLTATNINRGRDHGVPGYVYYVQYCTGVQIKKWPDLFQFIPENYVKSLSKIYKDFRDIDLFVGGLAERHMNDSIVGPTFGCLLSIQIYHWKYGDRFYFENGGQSGSFTLGQLNNIRSVSSLANLLCKTTDFDSIPEWPLFLSSTKNKKILCKTIPDLNYDLWREKDSCSSHCDYLKSKNLKSNQIK